MSSNRIVHRQNMRGGSPTIDGTRITVTDIVWNYRFDLAELANSAGPPDVTTGQINLPLAPVIDHILDDFPRLSREQVEAALAYWQDNLEEIEREIAENQALAVELQKKYAASQ